MPVRHLECPIVTKRSNYTELLKQRVSGYNRYKRSGIVRTCYAGGSGRKYAAIFPVTECDQ